MGEDDEDQLRCSRASRPEDATRSRCGRDGDSLLVSFECDEQCVFKTLYHSRPIPACPDDQFAMAGIRTRIYLYAFWSSRAWSTVAANTPQARKILESCKTLPQNGPFYPLEPLPASNHCGYKAALLDTLKQWEDTTAISNFHSLSLADNQGSS